jgi:two-component system nitrate/nitrite response regulator NarL
MPAESALHSTKNQSDGDNSVASSEAALRLLIAALAQNDFYESPPRHSAEEILLDIELDGARYLVVRLPRPSACSIQLSPREQEIARMVAAGHPNKVIAGFLNISSWTVSTHLRRIFAKLGVGSRAAMVARFLELRIQAQSESPRDAA